MMTENFMSHSLTTSSFMPLVPGNITIENRNQTTLGPNRVNHGKIGLYTTDQQPGWIWPSKSSYLHTTNLTDDNIPSPGSTMPYTKFVCNSWDVTR